MILNPTFIKNIEEYSSEHSERFKNNVNNDESSNGGEKTLKEEFGLEIKEKSIEWDEINEFLGEEGGERLASSVARRLSWVVGTTSAIDRSDLEQEARLSIWKAWQEKKFNGDGWKRYKKTFLKYYPDKKDVLDEPEVFGRFATLNAYWEVNNRLTNIIGNKGTSNREGLFNTYGFSDYETSVAPEDEDYVFVDRISNEMVEIDEGTSINDMRDIFIDYLGDSVRGIPTETVRRVIYDECEKVLENRLIRGRGQDDPERTKIYEKMAFRTMFMARPRVEVKGEGHNSYRRLNIREMLERYIKEGTIKDEHNLEKQYNTFKRACQRVTGILSANRFLLKDNITERLEDIS